MNQSICSVQACDRAVGRSGAKGMCYKHYRRAREGRALGEKPVRSECTIAGCRKLPRSKHAELCAMHYHRKRRDGEAGEIEPRKRAQRNLLCSVGGCESPDARRGLCVMHATRLDRHGDVEKRIALADRNMPTGEDHPHWKGEGVGYGGAHSRIQRARGAASEKVCVDCGGAAQQWSYTHAAPNERVGAVGGGNFAAYSPSPDFYEPRCVPCHKKFDLGRRDAAPNNDLG